MYNWNSCTLNVANLATFGIVYKYLWRYNRYRNYVYDILAVFVVMATMIAVADITVIAAITTIAAINDIVAITGRG
jgi:hypothetical protein